MRLTLNIKIIEAGGQEKEFTADLNFPQHFRELYSSLSSDEINNYIISKTSIDIDNDDLSASSVDIYSNDYQYETTSNDDSWKNLKEIKNVYLLFLILDHQKLKFQFIKI